MGFDDDLPTSLDDVEEIIPDPNVFKPGDAVQFRIAKQHYRDELGHVKAGDRGHVVDAQTGNKDVYAVELHDGRTVLACGPVELQHVKHEITLAGTEHWKYMIRKGFILDENEDLPGSEQAKAAFTRRSSSKQDATRPSAVDPLDRGGSKKMPKDGYHPYHPFRLPIGPAEQMLQAEQLALVTDPDGSIKPRSRSLKANANLQAVSKLWDTMLNINSPTASIQDCIIECARYGVNATLLTYAKRRAQRREATDRARTAEASIARPRFRGDPIGIGSVSCLVFFRHHTELEHLCSIDVEETEFDESEREGLRNRGSFIDIDGFHMESTREILEFFCKNSERFMAGRYYQGDGSDPKRKEHIDKAMDFFEEHIYKDIGPGQWCNAIYPVLQMTERDKEIDFLLQTIREADASLFVMSHKELYERECVRLQAREDRLRLVHSSAERLAMKILEKASKELLARMTEFADVFMQEKFVGGATELSIMDFMLAPVVFPLRHRGVARELRFRLPQRFETWLIDFEQAVPWSQQTFFSVDADNDIMDSLNEYLTEHVRPLKFDTTVMGDLVVGMSVAAKSRQTVEGDRPIKAAPAAFVPPPIAA